MEVETRLVRTKNFDEMDKLINPIIRERKVVNISHAQITSGKGGITYVATILLEKENPRQQLLEG